MKQFTKKCTLPFANCPFTTECYECKYMDDSNQNKNNARINHKMDIYLDATYRRL